METDECFASSKLQAYREVLLAESIAEEKGVDANSNFSDLSNTSENDIGFICNNSGSLSDNHQYNLLTDIWKPTEDYQLLPTLLFGKNG